MDFDSIVGFTVVEASQKLGVPVRASFVNGEPQMVTMDYNPSRINVDIDGTTKKILRFVKTG